MVAIKGNFARDDQEFNGLEEFADELIANPLSRKVVVGVIETARIVRDITAGGVETATVRFVQLEVLSGADGEQVEAMMDTSYRTRTGRAEAPQDSLFDAPQTDREGPWPGDVDYDTPNDVEASQ